MVLLGLLAVEAQRRPALARRARAAAGAGAASPTAPPRRATRAARGRGCRRPRPRCCRHVARVVVGGDVGHRHRADHLRPADDRPAERVVAEDRAGEHVVDLVRGLVLVHRDLLDHDLALGVDVRIGRPQHHVLEHVERALEVLVEEARVDRGRLLARAGVDLGPHPVEDLVDLERGEAVGALEQQVLEEVRDPRLLGLSSREPVRIQNPSAIDRTEGIALGHDPDARVERGQLGLLPCSSGYSVAIPVAVARSRHGRGRRRGRRGRRRRPRPRRATVRRGRRRARPCRRCRPRRAPRRTCRRRPGRRRGAGRCGRARGRPRPP